VIPALLFAFAQERVTTVVSSIINSATPIATLVVMLLAFRDELPSLRQTSGILVGLVGALIALGIQPGSLGENDPLAVLALVGAIFCYGIGIPFSHKYVLPLGVPTKTMATFQVGIATVILAPIYFFQPEPLFTAVPDAWVVTQILLMGFIGTGFAYIWNFDMIERAGSAIASSVSYPTLLVSLIIGWLVLKEPFTWQLPIGAVLVVIGSAITQWRPAASKALR
jgi:drug/metabolite transporter (DMT)-like permease